MASRIRPTGTTIGTQWYLLIQTWKLVAGEIGSVAGKRAVCVMQGDAAHDPADVCPPAAFGRGVGVAFVIGELVMHAMR